MAAGEGFEPSHTESESAVLPLHKPAIFARSCHTNRYYYTGKHEFVKGFFEKNNICRFQLFSGRFPRKTRTPRTSSEADPFASLFVPRDLALLGQNAKVYLRSVIRSGSENNARLSTGVVFQQETKRIVRSISPAHASWRSTRCNRPDGRTWAQREPWPRRRRQRKQR